MVRSITKKWGKVTLFIQKKYQMLKYLHTTQNLAPLGQYERGMARRKFLNVICNAWVTITVFNDDLGDIYIFQ